MEIFGLRVLRFLSFFKSGLLELCQVKGKLGVLLFKELSNFIKSLHSQRWYKEIFKKYF